MSPAQFIPLTPSGEVPLDFDREWYSFTDPGNEHHLISVDLTWLLSRWGCAFGTQACKGIDTSRPELGCCAHGAFLSDEEDLLNLHANVERLDADLWQLREATLAEAEADGSLAHGHEAYIVQDEVDDEPAWKTRTLEGACVFLNRPGNDEGAPAGCVFHTMAIQQGLSLVETKPEVCWQLPLRRTQEWETRPDGQEILHTRLGEYDRRGWGEGGLDLDWYCTSDPGTHQHSTALWKRHIPELTALLGAEAFEVVQRVCTARERTGLIAPHPATDYHC